ncbi:hypothetical protein [Bifidobacterium margollesii]|nr:hypothetical protein [Bifidobacterium margollesii]
MFLNALAPVDDGFHLDFMGEDGPQWRYAFENGRMLRLQGLVVFG